VFSSVKVNVGCAFRRDQEDSDKLMKENTEQLKGLNDRLALLTQGDIRLPGVGGGGMGGGGGGDGGGSAPYGSGVGPGTGAGAGGGAPGKGPCKTGKGDDPRGMEAYIRETTKKYGVDPDTAVRVAHSEGLRGYSGDRGTSFGAFQLHVGGGLGDTFQKETGLDPRDPKNERAMIDWTLKNVNKTGWGPYHGARNTGIGPREGLGGGAASGGSAGGGYGGNV
jgi:hypothetical protein